MSKLSSPQERLKLKTTKSKLAKTSIVATTFAVLASLGLAPIAGAVNHDAKINELRQQNNAAAAAQSNLEAAEETLAAKVSSLRASIAETEAEISKQQSRISALNHRIAEIEEEMVRHRETLGVSIKQIYMDEQVTTIEKVAMSKDWSEYADKEQYNLSVKDKIKQTLDKIKELKIEQEKQKVLVEKILAEQQARHSQLAADRAEAGRLLSLNQAEQAEYDRQISTNNAKISQLQREQAAHNARSFVGGMRYAGTGSYPWPNVPFPNTIVDPWGMYKRQCVSYTAWKVASTGRHMPYWGGRGNAKLWDDNARAAGIPVSTTPKVGSVAVDNSGTYGHVMYVEAVHGDGTISISQYNAAWDGRYSEGRRSAAGLYYIHF